MPAWLAANLDNCKAHGSDSNSDRKNVLHQMKFTIGSSLVDVSASSPACPGLLQLQHCSSHMLLVAKHPIVCRSVHTAVQEICMSIKLLKR